MTFWPPSHRGNTLPMQVSQPEESWDHEAKGDFYYRQTKNPAQAQNLLNQAINEYLKAAELKDDPQLALKIARAYLLNGQLEKGIVYAEKALQKGTFDKAVFQQVRELQSYWYARHGQIKEAETALSDAIGMKKPWQTGKLHLAMSGFKLESATEKRTLGRWFQWGLHAAVGASLLPFTMEWNTVSSGVAVGFNSVLNRFRAPEQALESWIDLFHRFPGSDKVGLEIGKAYLAQDQYREAEFWFARTLARHPGRDESYRYLVDLYRNTHDFEQLIETLENWLNIRPNSGELMLLLSQTLSYLPDRLEDSISWAKQSLLYLKQPMMLAETYAHLGILYSAMQQVDVAIVAYESALSLCPSYLDVYVQLGTLYYDKKEYLLSQKIFEKAMSFSPDNARILCNLGYLAWMQGNINQALAYYHRSVELDPGYDIALNNLGVLYLDHIGDIGKAMQLFEQTLNYNPYYALCHYNMGRAYSFLGHTIEAARCFTHAKDLNGISQELDSRDLTERIKQLFENTETPQQTDL